MKNERLGLLVNIYELKKVDHYFVVDDIEPKYDQLILLPNEVFPNIPQTYEKFDNEGDEIFIEIHCDNSGDDPYYYAQSILDDKDKDNDEKIVPIFSGSFIYTTDKHFPFSHPIHLHNLYEKS